MVLFFLIHYENIIVMIRIAASIVLASCLLLLAISRSFRPCDRHPQPESLNPNLVTLDWVLVKGFNLHYRNKETIFPTIDPYYGNLNQIS